jgi:hypothetical protein
MWCDYAFWFLVRNDGKQKIKPNSSEIELGFIFEIVGVETSLAALYY